MPQELSRTFSAPLHPDMGCRRVVIEVSVPRLPDAGAPVHFAEHVRRDGRATDTVIACTRGAVVVSEDLGASWETVPIPALDEVAFRNSFTRESGEHLLQGDASRDGGPAGRHGHAPVALLDSAWELVSCTDPGFSAWHGTRSIDEEGGALVYAEYPRNRGRRAFMRDPAAAPPAPLRDSRLLRSTDGGRSWETVLCVDWREIRHFHTVVADPWRPGRWWASSGDAGPDCRVWESLDGGASWAEMPVELPADELHPRANPRSVLRHTDVAVRESDLIWGTDDMLGGWLLDDAAVSVGRRPGARLMRSGKERPWKPRTIAYLGNPARSLVDVGFGYIVTTEAQGFFGYRPDVCLLWKSEPFALTPLAAVDNFRAERPRTGFTYSRASRSAKDGVFFTYRSGKDMFPGGPGILRWRVLLD